MLANDIGNSPERLLLFSLLIQFKQPKLKLDPKDRDSSRCNSKVLELDIVIAKFQTHMYSRLLRWPKEEGIFPVKKLSERSSV
jgi:hypothetical protein